jgi:hypothetical protein
MATLKFYAVIEIIDMLLGRKVSQFLEDVFGSQLMATVVKALMGAFVAVMAIAPLRELWFGMFPAKAIKAQMVKMFATSMVGAGTFDVISAQSILISLKGFIKSLYTKILLPIFGKGGFLWQMLGGIGVAGWLGPAAIIGATSIRKDSQRRSEIYEGIVADMPQVITPFGVSLRALSQTLQNADSATKTWKSSIVSLLVGVGTLIGASFIPGGVPFIGFAAKLFGFSQLFEGLFDLTRFEALTFPQLRKAVVDQQTMLAEQMIDAIRDTRLRGVFEALSERYMDVVDKTFVTALEGEVFTHPHSAIPKVAERNVRVMMGLFEVMYQFEELQSLLTRIEVPGEGVRFMLRESGRDAIVELLGRLKKTDELYIALDSFWKQTDSLSFNLPFTAPIGRVDRIAYILTHRMDSFAYTVNEVGTVVNQSIMQMLTRVESLAGYVTAEDYDAIVNRIVAWSEAFLVGGLIPESGMLDDLDRQIQELERQVGKVNLGKVAGTALRELNALVLKDYLVELAESLDPHTLIAQLETTLARTTPGLSLLTPVDTLGTTIRDLLLDEQIEPALNEIVKAVTSLDDDMRTQGLRWARGFIGVLEELQLDIFSYQDILTIQYLMAQLTLAERGQGTPLERSVSELLLGMLRFAEGNYSLVEQVMGFLEYLDTVKPDMNIENIAAEFESYMGDAFAELFKPTIGEILGVRVANALLDIVRDTDFSFVVGDRQVFDPLRGVLYPDSATQKQFVDPMNVFIREYLGRAMPMLLPDVGDVDAIFTAISRIFKLDSVAPELLSSVTSVLRDMSARIAKEIDVSTGDVVISDVLDEYYEFIRSALGADSEAVRIFEALGSQFIELEKLFRSPGAQQALTAFHNVENVEQLLKVFTEVGLNNQEAAKELLEFWKTVITETNKITEQVIKTRDSLVRGLPELSKFYSERETRAKFEFYMNMMAVLFSPVELMSSLLMDVYDASLMPMHRWDYELPQLLTPNMMNEWFEQNIGLLVQFGLITDAEIQRIAADTSGAALGEYIDRLRAGTDSFSAYADGMFAFTEVMMEIDKLQDPFRERDIRYMTGQEIWTWGTRLYNNFAAFFSSASAVLFDPALWQGIMDSTTSLSVIIEEIGEGVAERFNDALYLPHNEFMRRLGEYGFRTEEFMKEMRIEDARASVLKAAQAMDLNIDNLDEWALSLADIVDGWIIRVPKPGAGGEFGAQAVGLEEKAEEFFEINLGVFYRWYDNLTSVVENYTKGLADEAFQLLGVSFKLPIASALVTTFTGYGKKLVEGWLRDQTAKIMVGVYNWLMGSTEEGPGAFAKFFQESDLLVDEEISDFAFAIASDVARLANQGLRVLLDLALGRLDVAIARLASYFVFDEGAVVGINWQRLMPSVLSFFGKLDETVAKETVRHYVEFFAEGSFLQTLQDALDKYETGDIIARDLERIFSEQWREVRNFTRDVAGEIFDNRFISGILQGLVSIFFWVTERMGAHEWILSAFAKTDPIQGLYSMIGAEAVPDLLSNLPIREWSEELWQIAIGGLIESGQVNINAMKKHLRTYEEFDLSDDQVNQYLRMVTNSIHELLTMRIEEYITSEDLQRLGVDSAFILEEFPTIGELVGLLRLASLDDTIFAPGVIDGFLDAFRIDPETLTKEMPNIIRDIVDFVTANKAEFEQVLEKYGDVVKLQQIAGVPFLGGIMERLVAEAVGVRPDQIDWMKVFEDLNPDETNKIMEEFNSQVETLISIASQAGAMLVSIADNMEELDWGSETMRNWIQFTGRSIQHLIEAINVMVMGQTIAGILGLGDWTTWIFLGIAALAGILAAIVDWKRIFGGVSDLLDKSLVAIQNNTSAMQSLTNILDSLNNTLYNQPGAFAYGYMMPGFATGGITGGAPAEIAGVVHGGEWVAPAWMVGHNVYGKQIAELESVRARGFRTGGYTSDSFGLDHTDRIEIIPKQDVSIVVNVTINGDMSNPDEVLDKVEDRVLRAFKRSRV